jgi:hypothetical protein
LDKEYDKIMRMLEDLARKYEELSKRVKELEREIKGEGRFEEAEERYMEERRTPVYRRSISSRTRVPREPISKWASFPRRLTSEEIDVFWRVFANKLMGYGLNPEDDFCIDHWKNFRDAHHESWEQIIERFNQMIEDILTGRSPRTYPPPPIEIVFKETPREQIIWTAMMDSQCSAEERAKNVEELAEKVWDYTKVKVTAEQVKKILEEEYAKGENANTWFKIIRENRSYYLWNIGFRPKELEEKVRRLVCAALGTYPKTLKDIVDFVREAHGYIVSEDEAKKWIKEELEKPPDQADVMVKIKRSLAEELVK